MKKNLKKVGFILSMVAMTSFAMTSCAEATEEVTTETPAPVVEEVAPVVEEVAPIVEEVAPVIEEVAPEAAPAGH